MIIFVKRMIIALLVLIAFSIMFNAIPIANIIPTTSAGYSSNNETIYSNEEHTLMSMKSKYCSKNEEIEDGNWTMAAGNASSASIHSGKYRNDRNDLKHYAITHLWKPQHCDLVQFAIGDTDPLLPHLAHRKIVFFGDSLLRNIYASFYLLLSTQLQLFSPHNNSSTDSTIAKWVTDTDFSFNDSQHSFQRIGAIDRFGTFGDGYWSIHLHQFDAYIDMYWANTVFREHLQPHTQLRNNSIAYDTIIQYAYAWEMGARWFQGFNRYRDALYKNMLQTCQQIIQPRKHTAKPVQYLWFQLHKLYPERCPGSKTGKCVVCNNEVKADLFRRIMKAVISDINYHTGCDIAMVDTLSFTNTSFAAKDGSDAVHFGATTTFSQLQVLLNIILHDMSPMQIPPIPNNVLQYDYDAWYFKRTAHDGTC